MKKTSPNGVLSSTPNSAFELLRMPNNNSVNASNLSTVTSFDDINGKIIQILLIIIIGIRI